MSRSFYDWNHANQYLHHSVILINKRLAFVASVNEDELIKYIHHDTRDEYKRINLKDPNVEFALPELGWVNQEQSNCYYTARVPVRAWSVGLTRNNCAMWNHNGRQLGRPIDEQLYNKFLQKTVDNNYPSFKEALKINENGIAVAFSKRFAITDKRNLAYKTLNEPVGLIENGKPVIKDEYFYLRESLMEDAA